ncbi:MFS general substrate transporter [Clavulina sp. PMI_390]|nr:MFS general substrate transporter [Clavulina sp. PMI_390]
MASEKSIEENVTHSEQAGPPEAHDEKHHHTAMKEESNLHTRQGIMGFFSGLNREAAQRVEDEADVITFTHEEEMAVRWKIDTRILPLIILSYISNQFDRTNIGNAHTLTLFNQNFGINTNNRWTLALSIFYVGYCLLEIPANILQRHIGANRFFFMSLTWWGLSSLSFVYAKGYTALLILRVCLGIGEAGYYAGMIYYLSFWYKRRELAFRISLCMTGVIPGWMSSLLAFGLVRAHTSLLTGWQFLFLIEAIPTLIMAVVILLWLPSFPFASTFLTPRERAIAVARLKDQRPKSHGGANGWAGLKLVVLDPLSWMFAVLYVSFNICTATISYFLPTLIKGFGYSAINAQGLTVGPYFVGWAVVWFQAWHSDYSKDRGYHVMASGFITFLGYLLLSIFAESNHKVAYFGTYLITAGAYSLFPLVMSWAANSFSPTSKRGVGTAFIVSISNCVSIASPQIYFDPKDSFRKAHGLAGGFSFLVIVMGFVIRTVLDQKNKHREKLLAEMPREQREMLEAESSGVHQEIPDTDIRYRYMT